MSLEGFSLKIPHLLNMINLIILAILILPFAIIPFPNIPEPTRLIKEVLFDFAMLGIIAIAMKNSLKFEYRNKYLSWIIIWGFFQIGFNWYYPMVRGFGFNVGTINESIHFILASIATILFCSSVEKNGFIRISKAIVISGTAIAIFGICQGIGLDPMKNIATYSTKEIRHVAATMDHPNLFGNYISLCVPFCLYLVGIRYKLCLVALLIALIMAKSSISIVAALIGIAIFVLLKYRNKISFYSISLGLLILIVFSILTPSFNKFGNGFTGRIIAWHEFIKRDVNPLFGNGFGISKSYGVQFGNNYWSTPHNDYISIWLSLGFVGLLLYFLLVINSLRNFNYNQGNTLGFAYLSSLITFFILMIGSFPMESAPIALIGLVSFWGVEKIKSI